MLSILYSFVNDNVALWGQGKSQKASDLGEVRLRMKFHAICNSPYEKAQRLFNVYVGVATGCGKGMGFGSNSSSITFPETMCKFL